MVSLLNIADFEVVCYDPFTTSPTFDEFLDEVSESLGSSSCGPFEYKIEFTNPPTLASGTLEFFELDPTLSTTLKIRCTSLIFHGKHEVKVSGWLTKYSNVEASDTFNINFVHPCDKTTIVSPIIPD